MRNEGTKTASCGAASRRRRSPSPGACVCWFGFEHLGPEHPHDQGQHEQPGHVNRDRAGAPGHAGSSKVKYGALIQRLLDLVPTLEKEHHWEGDFTGGYGSAAGSTIAVKARLGFHGPVIAGSGRLVHGLNDVLDGKDGFDVAAILDVDVVDLQLWFEAAVLARAPFVCAGLLSQDGREISGDWTVGCFNPDTCGCEGGGGDFRLQRID